MKNKILIPLLFVMLCGSISYSQKLKAIYERIPIFDGFPGKTVTIAIDKIKGNNKIEESLQTELRKNRKWSRYFGFVLNKNMLTTLNANEIDINNNNILQRINTECSAQILLTGEELTDNVLKIRLIETSSGKTFLLHEFQNSSNSTALKDLLMLINEKQIAKYVEKGKVFITVEPRDSKIYINDALNTKGFPIEADAGKLNLKIEKVGYNSVNANIDVAWGETITKDFKLEPMNSKLVLKVDPDDASVIIDGQSYNTKEILLKPGRHSVELRKQGYKIKYDTIQLDAGVAEISRTYTLEKSTARLSLVVNPSDAELKIDDNFTSERNDIDLSIGNHIVEVKKDDYETYNEKINLTDNDPVTLNITLKQSVGSLSIKVTPQDARVTLYKTGNQLKNWSGTKTINDLTVGNYTLKVESKNYKNITKDIIIERNKLRTEEVKLKLDIIINKVIAEGDVLQNYKFSREGDDYKIYYNLDGKYEDKFNIELFLTDEMNANFSNKLTKVLGDIGEEKNGGPNKLITWKAFDEYNNGLDNDHLNLLLKVEKIGGGIPWYYFAGGGALIGGVIGILSGGKGGGTSNGGTNTQGLPIPPPRPGN